MRDLGGVVELFDIRVTVHTAYSIDIVNRVAEAIGIEIELFFYALGFGARQRVVAVAFHTFIVVDGEA
ncbi:MAG: hypothetical protein C4586_04250 [Anaerolineaceae bacterium]|nr:MAG: hypothetical protein C4586_04250 [Anaerolineaceae bacterium]